MDPAKILIVANFRGWAWDHKARNLQGAFSNKGFSTEIIYMYDYVCDPETGWIDSDYRPNQEFDYTGYDVILLFSPFILQPMMNNTLDLQKTFVGICSHSDANFRKESDVFFLNQFRGVFVLNRLLFDQFAPLIHNLYYCPNGVDTAMFFPFKPVNSTPDFTIGWAGNPDHRCNKKFYEIVEPLASSGQWRFKIADNKHRIRSHDEMIAFFNDIDVYLCVSVQEGTPNPCLEAMSCGRPVITTPVGNMPELILEGYNGIFVNSTMESVERVLHYLADHREVLSLMGENARRSIIPWDWKDQAQHFIAMLDPLLHR